MYFEYYLLAFIFVLYVPTTVTSNKHCAVREASSVAVHVICVTPIGNVLSDTRGPPPVSTQSTEAVPPALAASVALGLKVTVAPVEAVACSSPGAVQAGSKTGTVVSFYFSHYF